MSTVIPDYQKMMRAFDLVLIGAPDDVREDLMRARRIVSAYARRRAGRDMPLLNPPAKTGNQTSTSALKS